MNKLWLGLPNTVEHTTLKFSTSSKSSFCVFAKRKNSKEREREKKETRIINLLKNMNMQKNGHKRINIPGNRIINDHVAHH